MADADSAGHPRRDHLGLPAAALLLSCCAFWGLQQVLVKATLAEMPAAFQAMLRFTASTLCLMVWCRVRGIALFGRDGSLWPGLLVGALFAGEMLCVFLGLQYIPASRLTVFLYASPLWAALILPWVIRSERLRALQWVGLLLAFLAVAYTLRDGLLRGQTASQHWGDILGLASGLFWAMTTVTIRSSRLMRASAEKLLFYQVACTAVAGGALSLLLGDVWVSSFSPFAITSLALQSVVGGFASYLVWMWMLGRYPATKIGAFALSTPVFALIFGALWLGEPVHIELVAALATVIFGITLVNRKPAAAQASATLPDAAAETT
jgi:drug/metabolite transporter (DMT)-like permease